MKCLLLTYYILEASSSGHKIYQCLADSFPWSNNNDRDWSSLLLSLFICNQCLFACERWGGTSLRSFSRLFFVLIFLCALRGFAMWINCSESNFLWGLLPIVSSMRCISFGFLIFCICFLHFVIITVSVVNDFFILFCFHFYLKFIYLRYFFYYSRLCQI